MKSVERALPYGLPDLTAELCDFLALPNLLQHGHLPKAEEMTGSSLKDKDALHRLWALGHYMFLSPDCRWRYFAYTQVNPEVLDLFSIEPTHLRAIYLPSDIPNSNLPVRDVVLLNPQITWLDQRMMLNLEGCGSIADGLVRMAIRRPRAVRLTGLVWSPSHDGISPIDTIVDGGFDSGGMEHEIAHLDGLTAISDAFIPRLLDGSTYDLEELIAQDPSLYVSARTRRNWEMYREECIFLSHQDAIELAQLLKSE